MKKAVTSSILVLVFAAGTTMASAQFGSLADKAKNAVSSSSSSASTPASAPAKAAPAETRTMDQNSYKGKDRVSLEKNIAAAYTKRYSSDKVFKVAITDADWRAVKELVKGVKVTNYYISAQVAVDKGQEANVWNLTFKKVGGGVELSSIGESFRVAKSSIK